MGKNMVNKKAIEQFNKMFDLTSDEDESDQAEEYGHSTESNESFEQLSEEMSEEIGNLEEKGAFIKEDPHDIIKEVSSKKESDYEESASLKEDKEDFIDNLGDNDIDFDLLEE